VVAFDNEDWMVPNATTPNGYGPWVGMLAASNYMKTTAAFDPGKASDLQNLKPTIKSHFCPSLLPPQFPASALFSYGSYLRGHTGRDELTKVGQVPNGKKESWPTAPSSYIFAIDSGRQNVSSRNHEQHFQLDSSNATIPIHARHNQAANGICLDGHAMAFHKGDLMARTTTKMQLYAGHEVSYNGSRNIFVYQLE